MQIETKEFLKMRNESICKLQRELDIANMKMHQLRGIITSLEDGQ